MKFGYSLYMLGLLLFTFLSIVNESLQLDQLMYVAVILLLGLTFVNTLMIYLSSLTMYIDDVPIDRMFDMIGYLISVGVAFIVSSIIFIVCSAYIGVAFPIYEYTIILYVKSLYSFLSGMLGIGFIVLFIRMIPWARIYHGSVKYFKNMKDAKDKDEKEKSRD